MHVRKVPQDNFTLQNIEYQKLNPTLKLFQKIEKK